MIYLASQSPRRRQLLEQLGVAHQVLLPEDSEAAERLEEMHAGELPMAYVQRVTRLKLEAALRQARERGIAPAPILASDTTVAVARRILGKPTDAEDARRMLALLGGRTHRVLTAVALHDGRSSAMVVSVSRVRFAPLPPHVVDHYVASGEPFGKAGAYAIQGALAGWIEHIEGSYSGIMGLPLFETAHLLQRAGVALELTRGAVSSATGRRRRSA